MKMKTITTVLGELEPEKIGFTDMHTHLQTKMPEGKSFTWSVGDTDKMPASAKRTDFSVTLENLHDLRRGFWADIDGNFELDDPQLMREELSVFHKLGGKTLVECSPTGTHRNLQEIKAFSAETGLNIILCTGFYAGSLWPAEYTKYSCTELVNHMLNEIENGIEGTDIKPGIVKIACNEFSELEKRGLKAAAIAARESGLCLQVHTGGAKLNPGYTYEMTKLVKNEGMDLERTIFLHMDQFVTGRNLLSYIVNHDTAGKLNLDPIKKVLDTGANIGFDAMGAFESKEISNYLHPGDYEKTAGLYTLIQDGYAGQIFLGSDVGQRLAYRKYGGAGYGRLLEFVIPTLKQAGVSDEMIDEMTIHHPARILAH